MSDLEQVVIDINPNDTQKSSINLSSRFNDSSIMNKASSNFGGGIELLMNNKKKGSSIELGLGELSDLETELNELTSNINTKTLENSRSNLFTSAINSINSVTKSTLPDFAPQSASPFTVKFEKDTINLGEDTAGGYADASKSWDGYGKFNNIPVASQEAQLTKEEMVREKFKFLRRLEDLERKGANLTKKYTMDSPLAELQGEYEMIIAEKEKSNSVKFQGRMLMAAITGIEFLNNKFDPFDLKMDGWAEQVNENVSDYDEIFAELHEKYKSKAKLAPELKLLFQLGGSAIMVHMTNTMFKSAMPGMDDIMKQNPELMQQFTQAAVNSMGESRPGFGNFMNNFMPGSNSNSNSGSGNMDSGPPPQNMGAPPPAVNTQQAQRTQRYAPPQNRPDLTASRVQEGISIHEQFGSVDNKQQQTNIGTMGTMNINASNYGNPNTNQTKRAEMKGPSDISRLLSGLKPKPPGNIQIQNIANDKDPSTISVSDLKELSNQRMPKSNRKTKTGSAKNTISLDL